LVNIKPIILLALKAAHFTASTPQEMLIFY